MAGRDPATYRKLIAEQEARGWSMRELARRSGIPYWTLMGWKRRLRAQTVKAERPAVAKPPAIMPVTVVEPVAPKPRAARGDDASRAVVELRGGVRLLLPATMSPEDLARLALALEAAC